MDFQHIQKLMDELNKREIPKEFRQKIEDEFEIDYTYDSLALSGAVLLVKKLWQSSQH